MSRLAKLNSVVRDFPNKQQRPSVRRKSVQSRQYQCRRRVFRRLFAEPLEWRILLTSVTAVNPPANSHSAQVSTDVAATFDQNINPATATPQNFVVHSMQRGQLVGASTAVSAAGPTVTSNPTSDFFPGELLQASVTSAIQSTGGQGAVSHVWQLRTAVSGGSGEFSDSGQSLGNVNNSYGVSLGDVDGDGDLDAFVATRSQGNLVWINQGGAQSGTAGTFNDSGQSLGNSDSVDVSLGDVDGDGDLDAYVANQGGYNYVWLNQGGLQSGTAGTFSDSGQSLGELGDSMT